MLCAPGRTNDLRKLRAMLRIVATDLDSGSEVRFGEPGRGQVPISQAIRASTALPGLYTPVRLDDHSYVDGTLLRTVHASLVLDHGADLVISVNPLVTFDASASAHQSHHARRDLAAGGLITVLSQTFRALIQSRKQIGMAAYRDRYPSSDRLLIQPDRDDATMFFFNVFRYKERRALANHAYQQTRRDLLAQADVLAPLLAKYGFTLHACALQPASRGHLRLGPMGIRTPLIIANYLNEPHDLAMLLEALQVSRQILNAKPFEACRGKEIFPAAHLTTSAALTGFIRCRAETIYHPVGTCRMSKDAEAVVDAQHGDRWLDCGQLRIRTAGFLIVATDQRSLRDLCTATRRRP
jgi:hypothetical protein